MEPLDGKTIAFLIFDNFEESDYVACSDMLENLGAVTEIVSPNDGPLQGLNYLDYGASFVVNRTLPQAKASEYDALVVPGGAVNIDDLRQDPRAHDFLRAFEHLAKPIVLIGHAPWLAVSAGIVEGVRLTSAPSLQPDITNAGGEWTEQETVRDGVFITSRSADTVDMLTDLLIEAIDEQAA